MDHRYTPGDMFRCTYLFSNRKEGSVVFFYICNVKTLLFLARFRKFFIKLISLYSFLNVSFLVYNAIVMSMIRFLWLLIVLLSEVVI